MAYYARTAKVGFIWGILSRGMTEAISIPSAMLLARLLSPYDFGVAAAAGFFTQVAQRLTNFGFNTALVQVKELTEAHRSTVFMINAVLGAVLSLLLILASPWLGSIFNSPAAATAIPVASLAFALGSLGAVPAALLVRDLKFRQITYTDWANTWVTVVVGLILAWRGWGFWSIVYSQLAATAAQTMLRFWYAGWYPRLQFSREVARELLSFGFGLHIKRLLEGAAQNVDNLVIGRTLGLSLLGYYDKAFTMMSRAVIAVNTAGPGVSFRIFAIIQDDTARFQKAVRKVLMTATFLAYPVLTLLIVLAPELFRVMFGPKWDPAVVPFQILCAAGFLKVLIAYISTATQSRGWIWGEVWRQASYVTLIVAAVAVGSRWGLPGASWGVFVSTTAMTVLMFELLRRASGLHWSDFLAPQIPAVSCCAGLVVVMLAAKAGLVAVLGATPPAWLSLLVGAAAGAAFVLLFVWFARFRELRGVVVDTCQEFAPGLARVLKLQA